MSLTTKPRPHATHKKVQGAHHRHTKNYLKTYWPYLPIAAIIAGGLIVDHLWHTKPSATLSSYTYFDLIESSLGVLALAIFLLRHAFAWRKVFVYGEQFVTKHPSLDVLLVSIATISLVISHHVL